MKKIYDEFLLAEYSAIHIEALGGFRLWLALGHVPFQFTRRCSIGFKFGILTAMESQ
jgi:hypothetical protein